MALKARAHESDLRSGGGDQRKEALQPTPIDLSPLVEPYKGYGKLTLRLEQLPAKARFSLGMRAGEKSWSLALEDLSGLNYLLPEGAPADHSVKIRIIGMERGDTLAVTEVKMADYYVAARKDAAPAQDRNTSPSDDEQLAKAQSAVGALQIRLSDALAEIEKLTKGAGGDAAAGLEAAKVAWKAEEDKRLAKAESEWLAKSGQQAAELRGQLDDALARMQAQLAEERRKYLALQGEKPAELQAELEAARNAWKAEESRRLAKAETEWAAQSSARIEELQVQLSEARKKHLKLQGETSTDWDAELESARQEWKADESKRLAKAEAAWAKQAAEKFEALQAQLADAQKKANAGAAAPAVSVQAAIAAAQAEWKADEIVRLGEAQKGWQARADSSVKALEAKWQAKLDELVALHKQEAAMPAKADRAPDAKVLKEAVSSLQAAVLEREAELERASKQLEAERASRRRETQELRAAHDAAHKAEMELRDQHAATLEQTETRWKQATSAEIKPLLARAEAAEKALADLRGRATDTARAEQEIFALRAAVEAREAELHHLRELNPAPAAGVPVAPTGMKKILSTPFLREILVGVVCTVATILVVPSHQGGGSPTTDALAESLSAQEGPVDMLLPTATVVRNSRLRVAPDKDAAPIVRVERGFEVGVLKSEGAWTQVKANHKTKVVQGWIESANLELVQAGPASDTK